MRIFIGIFLCFSFFTAVHEANAAGPIVRSGESVSVDADQVLEGDFYGLGGTVSVSGKANGDEYIGGGNVTINGAVAGDLGVVGGVVQVHAVIEDDVRIIGGEVVLAEPVKGDVVVLGGTLTILSTATVEGDVLFAGSALEINGVVKGSVYGSAGSIRIDGQVGGDVKVRSTQTFVLGDAADIGGNITYTSVTDLTRAQGAVVGGTVSKEIIPLETAREYMQGLVFHVCILLFGALTLFLVSRRLLENLVSLTSVNYGKQGLIGFGMFFAIPFISVLLITSVLGSMVGIALLFGYVLSLVVAWIASCIVFGSILTQLLFKRQEVTLMTVIFGTVAFGLLPIVPVIGPIVAIVLFIMVLGGLGGQVYRFFR